MKKCYTLCARQMTKPLLLEKALSRSVFKEKVEEHALGSIGEFYKARIAEKNLEMEWVNHWYKEARDLAARAGNVMFRKTRGFTDYRKAFEEALNEILSKDEALRDYAFNTLKDHYRFDVELPVTDEDRDDWANMIRASMERALSYHSPRRDKQRTQKKHR